MLQFFLDTIIKNKHLENVLTNLKFCEKRHVDAYSKCTK